MAPDGAVPPRLDCDRRASRHRRLALVLLSAASFIAVVDTTIVSIALPSIRGSLGLSPAGSQWVLNVYALAFGGLLLLFGRVGDLYGRRRLFVAGLVAFGAGSLLAGAAWEPALLIAGRFVQGVGAAAFVPASLALLTATFTGHAERSRAIGVYGAMAAVGFVVGMVGGGVISDLWGWRWVFFVTVPVAALTLAPARFVLTESRSPAGERRVDVLGALTVTGGFVAVLYAWSSAPSQGWLSAATLVTGAGGLALLVCFAAVERSHDAPLMPPALVARPAVMVPNAAIALQSMVGIAWLYVLTLYFQDVLGYSPLGTGLLFLPMTVASVVAAPIGGRLAARVGVRRTAALGLALVGAGALTMTAGMSALEPVGPVAVGMMVGEAGFMLSNVSLTLAGTRALDDDRGGLAAGLLNTSIQLGSGLGLGVVAVVVATVLAGGTGTDPQVYTDALQRGMLACTGFAALGFLLVLTGLRRDTP